MKKFWNLMLAALVIIGAAACTENYENIEKAEGFSFYAEIANGTRAYIADEDGDKTWETKWQLGDKLYVEGYEFECTDVETGKFTCYNDEVAALVGQPVTITTDGKHHSLQGAKAFYTTATVENFGEGKVELQPLTSFFRFTYNGTGDVKFTLSEPLFRTEEGTAVNEITVSGNGEQFVAFWPNGAEAKLTFSANGETKEVSKAFVAGMVYNLGDRSPVYKVYVLPQPKSAISKWEKFNLYTWVDGGINNSWPGAEITSNTEVVNGYTYYVYQYSSDFNGKTVNAIVNNGSTQTGDIKLGVLNTNYYLVVNSLSEVKVSTTAPAAGSVEEAKEIPDTLYLKPNSNWTQANARFAAYFFGNGEKWISMTKTTINGGTYYKVSVPEGYPSVIFCRMNPSASANSWNNKWNQTGDLTIPTDGNNLFTVPDGWWDNATTGWSKL